ncbi:hypothetical protein KY347_05945 [Candidatus Woesearchaeota archaeon]|nr:hypothetical protein [Candidatus Woesearchaeota archaeon]
MFNLEIENKIIDFIKKSPLGVSSSDIASYVGLNRMTITKYLAIIKEKALIDFKQFGMAKLWYIPVNITKESFLSKIMANISLIIPKEDFKNLSEKVGISLGEEINQMYLNFYGTGKLSFDQILDAYADIGKKLGGNFKTKLTNEKISVEIAQLPFEKKISEAIIKILSALFAKIASINFGYARAVVLEQKEGENIVIGIYLKKEEK